MVRLLLALLLAVTLVVALPTLAASAPPSGARDADAALAGSTPVPADRSWRWPASPVEVREPFAAPAHAYAAGHRGVDLSATGVVTAPAAGAIAFAGVVVDRPLVTIDHGDGLVSTLEPVETDLAVGDVVAAGYAVGVVATGGHAAAGTIHFGVRLHGEYINPMLLLGGVPRAVLLPCC